MTFDGNGVRKDEFEVVLEGMGWESRMPLLILENDRTLCARIETKWRGVSLRVELRDVGHGFIVVATRELGQWTLPELFSAVSAIVPVGTALVLGTQTTGREHPDIPGGLPQVVWGVQPSPGLEEIVRRYRKVPRGPTLIT
jgi:hypothetical protein